MPPQAVQPYLGGSSEQRFNTDLVLYVEAEEVVVVAVSMVSLVVCCGCLQKKRVHGRVRGNR